MRDPGSLEASPPGAERKLVTVLLADVDEPLDDFDERDPEDVGGMLARHLERVREEVQRFGGSVEHVIGGRAVAVFGVPRTREDDPERAVRAALAIRDALGGRRDHWGQPSVRLHLAVATGEALVRLGRGPGGVQRVTGDVVSTCTRLQEAVPAGAILVTEATARATERAISYAPPSIVGLRGGEPVTVWTPLEPRTAADLELEARRMPSLVAREAELRLLVGRLEQARDRRTPQMVVLAGPPGIGKTRLVAELERHVEAGPELIAWRQGRGLPYGDGVSLWALAEIVKAEAGVLESDTAAQAEAKLDRVVEATVAEPDAAAWVSHHLRRLVGVGVGVGVGAGRGDPGETAAGEPVSSAQRVDAFAAWRRFLYGLAARRPLVLVMEDLHRADDALLEFLTDLTNPQHNGVARDAPLLVVGTTRPELLERRPDWAVPATAGAGTGTLADTLTATGTRTLIQLAPLSDDDTGQLLETLLIRNGLAPAAPDQLREQIGGQTGGRVGPRLLARVGGNPLFAQEYVRMLRDRGLPAPPDEDEDGWPGQPAPGRPGDLAGRSGAGAAEPPPTTVHAIIAARLDALPPDEKAVLQDAAVLGQVGWVGALAEIGRHDRRVLEECLANLERRELVARSPWSRVEGEVEFAFGHVLVRDVAYGQIVRAGRADKHRRAAAWIEALGQGRAEDRAELLAHHYLAALTFARAAGQRVNGLSDRARAALRDAGDRAATLGVFTTAARYYTQALELCPDGHAERAELLLRVGRARVQGDGTGEEELTRARDALLASGDTAYAAEAETLLATLAYLRGRGDERADHLAQALELAADAPPSRPKAAVLRGCMFHFAMANQHSQAKALAREVLGMATTLGLTDLEADAHGTIGLARVDGGDAGGITDLRRAIELLDGAPGAIGWHLNLAYAHAALGDLSACAAALRSGELAAERFASTLRLRSIQLQQVAVDYWAGRWDDAVRTVDELVTSPQTDRHYLEWECRTWRGRIRLARGDVSGALEDAARALALAREAADLQALNPTRAFRARALLATRRTDDAEDLVNDLLGDLGDSLLGPELGIDLPVVLAALEHRPGALDARGVFPSRWLSAARAYLVGEPAVAADIYAEIGSRPDEAYARLEAARQLLAAGRTGDAEHELAAATAFFRMVGATATLRQAEALTTGH